MKYFICVVIAVLFLGNLVTNKIHFKESLGKYNDELPAYELAVKNGFEGSVVEWAETLLGESVYVSNETWWIGKYDCKVTVESGDLEDNYKTEDVTVVRCHTDYKNHLLIETSNKYVISSKSYFCLTL